MAGEKSKTSGEIGEKIAGRLLEKIGWAGSLKNIPIPCNTRSHVNEAGNQRTSHGEDRVFFYNNPFYDARTDVVHVSVKNKSGAYSASEATLKRQFKEHLAELHEIIECAIYSEEINEALSNFKPKRNVFHSGLLIWLSNDLDSIDSDVKPALANMLIEQESAIPVYLLDASRASFLMKILDDVQRRGMPWSFYLPEVMGTSLTVDESRNKKFLPLELLASDIVPILISDGEKRELIIYADQPFGGNAYKKLMAYGFKFSGGAIPNIRIGMPDYNASRDLSEAQRVRLSFSEREEKVEPFSFNRSFLALLDEGE